MKPKYVILLSLSLKKLELFEFLSLVFFAFKATIGQYLKGQICIYFWVKFENSVIIENLQFDVSIFLVEKNFLRTQ